MKYFFFLIFFFSLTALAGAAEYKTLNYNIDTGLYEGHVPADNFDAFKSTGQSQIEASRLFLSTGQGKVERSDLHRSTGEAYIEASRLFLSTGQGKAERSDLFRSTAEARIDLLMPRAGATNYIQNTPTLQVGASFYISNATVSLLTNATISFMLNGRVTTNNRPRLQYLPAGWQFIGSSYSAVPISTISVDMTGSTFSAYRFVFTSTAMVPARDVMMTFNNGFAAQSTNRYATTRITNATLSSSSSARGVILLNISTDSAVAIDVTVASNYLNKMKIGSYRATLANDQFNVSATSNPVSPTLLNGGFSWNDYTQHIASVTFSAIGAVTGGAMGAPVSLKVFGASELLP